MMAMMEAMGGKSGPTPLEIFEALLASRKMAERVIEQLNLRMYYGAHTLSQTVNALQGETVVKGGRFKTLEITVLSKDPQMAAEIANAYVKNLDILYQDMNVSTTKRHRHFLELRLAEKVKKLEEAELRLKDFQTEHRLLSIEDQSTGAVGTAAELHAQIVALEVELAALREYASSSHPMINQLQAQIKELRHQLDMVDQKQGKNAATRVQGVRRTRANVAFPAFEEAPALALEFLRLTRHVKVEEAVYGMLVGMLEQAKISESRDLPTVQVIDAAIPAENKSKPQTLQNVLSAIAVAFIGGILLAVFLDYLGRLKAEEIVALPLGASAALTESNGDSQPGPNGGGLAVVRTGAPREIEIVRHE